MKIRYPDGNKPKGFAVLDEDGKLPSSVLPAGSGGGAFSVHEDLTNTLDKTCGEIMDAFQGGSVVQYVNESDSYIGISYLTAIQIQEGGVFGFLFGGTEDGDAFVGTGRDSYPGFYQPGDGDPAA